MRLTAKSEYGLLALIELACRTDGMPASAREVAEAQGIPAKFLEQLFVSLRKAGLLCARRGARGGFTLGRAATDITVLDIVEALEGPLAPTTCDGGASCTRTSVCAAGTVWTRATAALRDVFATTTLADLARTQSLMTAEHRAGPKEMIR